MATLLNWKMEGLSGSSILIRLKNERSGTWKQRHFYSSLKMPLCNLNREELKNTADCLGRFILVMIILILSLCDADLRTAFLSATTICGNLRRRRMKLNRQNAASGNALNTMNA